jgi:corrinoid protein of di/trimethylamine methyltransferase
MSSVEGILKTMHDAVVAFDEEGVRKAAEQLLAEGHDPLEGIIKGLAGGMGTVGELFKKQDYFVPEVLLCAEAMDAGVKVLAPHLKAGDVKSEGVVVLGTIQGDVHDIGKNLVKMMLEVGGFTVHDLGTDVPHERFVTEAARTNADIVGISAMMTTTMMGMKKVIQMLKQTNPQVAIMIGGAPVTPAVVKLFQADGFAANAAEVVSEARRVMATRQ